MPRLTDEQWAIARAKWEADQTLTYAQVGAEYGISSQAVHKRSQREGWTRAADGLAQMAARAHVVADRLIPKVDKPSTKRASTAGQVDKIDGEVDSTGAQPKPGRAAKPDDPPVSQEVLDRAVEERVEPRAKVLARHRTEVDGPRKLAYQALTGKDENGRALSYDDRHSRASLAKKVMETLKGMHEMERKAWGLDAGDSLGDKVIVIDRG